MVPTFQPEGSFSILRFCDEGGRVAGGTRQNCVTACAKTRQEANAARASNGDRG
jgi:hypothetical protein